MAEKPTDEQSKQLEQFKKFMDESSRQFKLGEALKPFLENYPLYRKFRFKEYGVWNNAVPHQIFLHCPECKAERPFKYSIPFGSGTSTTNPSKERKLLTHAPRHAVEQLDFYCAAGPGKVTYWVEINNQEKWIWKIGQLPMWLPTISKDIENELGEDAILYQKALRNMGESYGIGDCAYFRRLIEKYINPLLENLYEIKKEQNASPEELEEIQLTIKSKDFTAKTKYAAQIAPPSILVEGFNPLKEIHERLSVGIHTLDEETANQYAMVIHKALEVVLPSLRKHHKDRQAFIETLKQVRKLPAQ